MIRFDDYKFEAVPHCKGPLIDPTLIVMHWTAGGTMPGTLNHWRNPETNASAHFLIERDGTVVQCVSLDLQAFHTGESQWGGRKWCNSFSVGIELVNWGPVMVTTAKNSFRSEAGGAVDGRGCVKVGDDWYQGYTAHQWDALRDLVLKLKAKFPSIKEIVGHSEICIPAGRKRDPGPAFPMRGIRSVFEGRQ